MMSKHRSHTFTHCFEKGRLMLVNPPKLSDNFLSHDLSGKDMEMDMRNSLPGIFAAVVDHAETILKVFLLCQLCDNLKAMRHYFGVFRGYIRCTLDVFLWNHKKVDGSLWVNIAERNGLFVLINLIGRNLSRNYFTENAF